MILVNRFLTISTNVNEAKETPKREETFARNQINSCARIEGSKMEPFKSSKKKTGIVITKNITNLVSIRSSSDVFGFFSNCSSFEAFKENFKCTTLRFISHHVLVNYSASG